MNEPARRYPDVLEEISAHVAESLLEDGIDATRAAALGLLAAERVRQQWGGGTVYIPRGVSFKVAAMARQVYQRWTRANTRELCDELGVSERRIAQLYTIGRKIASA